MRLHVAPGICATRTGRAASAGRLQFEENARSEQRLVTANAAILRTGKQPLVIHVKVA